jgi:uncharacterized protein (UPF0262 family)
VEYVTLNVFVVSNQNVLMRILSFRADAVFMRCVKDFFMTAESAYATPRKLPIPTEDTPQVSS